VRATKIAAFGLLLCVSLWFKARGLYTAYWIDEGLSVGIGSHPFTDIPHVLRQDGSPPLYYMLLHVWMSWFGTGEFATQSLSTVIGLLCVPVAFWAGRELFGTRVAWTAAAMAAVNPFLTLHSYEARMYALMTLLGLLAVTAFVLAFVQRRRRWLPVFGVVLAAMLYTHNWALFFGGACVVALAWLWRHAATAERRALVRDGAIAFATTALLYLPWLPTLAFQARHTGAPWSQRPTGDELIFGTGVTIGGRGPSVALALAAGVAISAFAARRQLRELRTTQSLLIVFAGTVLLAFVASQLSPAWAQRYLAISLGPLLLFAAATLPNAGRMGMWALAIFLTINALPQPVHQDQPSFERSVLEIAGPYTNPGDLVIVTHPERVPIVRHYLGPERRYADLFGPVKDPQVMNWVDALDRIRRVRVARNLEPLLASVPLHGRVMLVRPIIDTQANSWKAPWTSRVWRQSRHWMHAINADPRFRPVISAPNPYAQLRYGIRAVVYERVRR
jgi:mannosyltransferase